LVYKHRLVIFRSLDNILSPEDLLKISRWFGKIETESYGKHPQSPSKEIYRVSNDEEEGFTFIGQEGWHIDGEYYIKPHAVMCMHMVKASVGGGTHFTPISNMLGALDDPKYDDMWFCTGDEDDE
jgi:alpha-ketoglutarate-dependent taurine dioxygenase